MAQRKRARPAMYELMKGQRLAGGGPPQHHAPVTPVDESEYEQMPTMSWLDKLRAGRLVRMPAGYLFISIAAVLLLLVFAYMFGYSRGETTTDTNGKTNTASDFSVNDPLANALANEPGSPLTNQNKPNANKPIAPSNTGKPLEFDMSKLGPVTSDPRVRGVNYYVLSTTNQAGAERLANFCRESGLAAFVVSPSSKSSLRQVIVLPGIESSALSSPTAQQLKDKILEVGRKWKETTRGNDDLSSAYAQQYGG